MADEKKILVAAKSLGEFEKIVGASLNQIHIEHLTKAAEVVSRLFNRSYRGVYISDEMLAGVLEERLKSDLHSLLELLPMGVVLLNDRGKIFWSNKKFIEIAQRKPIRGEGFYQVLDNPEIAGPLFSPFADARKTAETATTSLKNLYGRNYQFHVVPLLNDEKQVHGFLAVLEDVTSLTIINQKLQVLHDAAGDLVDLTPEELQAMSIDDRIDLLKSNIVKFIADILEVDVVEIRLLNTVTNELEPLLSMGMSQEASSRRLYASTENNGVTGFVAKLGKSYSIEDTQDDPLFLSGAENTKSSYTVPLMFHEEVIGTLNVESPIARAFTQIDELLITLFARDVAIGIHTLELLSAEKAGSAAASVEAIHSEVALPIDEILNDAVSLSERYIGLELTPDIASKFERILANARRIKTVIQRVGASMSPGQAHPTPPNNRRPLLANRRILVIDEDDSVRRSAHQLLANYGCIVETAPNGELALMLAKNVKYDVFIGAIKLPDMNGYDFMLRLIEMLGVDPPPYIMMVGFGYDSNHTRVKANQHGLQGVLFKPFRLDQLLNTVEKVIQLQQTPETT